MTLLIAIAAPAPTPDGARLYANSCASCHAPEKLGTKDGPSLRGIGLARVDFYLITGRMPAAVPWLQVGHRERRTGQQLSLGEIRALENYLAPTVAGGPDIPVVFAGHDLERGRRLYAANCEHCHAATGEGGALGQLTWAPSLRHVTIDVVADAIRAGPGEMPRFGEQQFAQDDLNDVAAYVANLPDESRRDVPPFRSTGPVPEGAAGYLAVIVLVAFVFTFWRVDTPALEREEAVRRDEGGGVEGM